MPCFAFRNRRTKSATPSKAYLQSLPVAGPPVLVLVAVHEAVQQGSLGAPKSSDFISTCRAGFSHGLLLGCVSAWQAQVLLDVYRIVACL